ncbi:Hexosyltransferase [Sergentomyia squamirostris]
MIYGGWKSIAVLVFGFFLCIYVWRKSDKCYEGPVRSVFPCQCDDNLERGTDSDPLLLKLPPEDRHRLIDLLDFDYVIQQKSCSELNLRPLALIVIHSGPQNEQKRNLIRRTWGRDKRSRLIFLLGTVSSTYLQASIESENMNHGDILQGNFIDAFHNLTYKHAMAFKWSAYFCPEAKYILKTDDDVFVNTPVLLDHLEKDLSTINISPKKLVGCYKVIGYPIVRDTHLQWRVSPELFEGDYFPPFCLGFTILYSPDSVALLYREIQRTHYFWIDDVHITGTLTHKARISVNAFNSLFLTRNQFKDIIKGKLNSKFTLFFFTYYNITEFEIEELWQKLMK